MIFIKKILYLFISFLFIFFCVDKIYASYKCTYYDSNGWWELHLIYEVDDDIKFSKVVDGGLMTFSTDWIFDYYLSPDYKELSNIEMRKKLIDFFDGKCQESVYVCETGAGNNKFKQFKGYAVLFDLQYKYETLNYNGKIYNHNSDTTRDDYYLSFDGDNNCFSIKLDDSNSTGNKVDSINKICEKYDDYYENLKQLYEKCDNNGNSFCEQYNITKSNLYSYCNSNVQHGDYHDPCLLNCLNSAQTIASIEKENIVEGSCNVSDRIIKWLANIVKWVKYIAPVLVIILGILDFIKAFASGNDDEMKKVKVRFVKRLIAAALLFIVPFIIEFVLDVFNLVTDNPYCNLF